MHFLVIIGGKPRAGKDAFADALVSHSPAQIRSLALSSILIAKASMLLGLPTDYFYENKELVRPVLQWLGEEYYKNLKAGGADYFAKLAIQRLVPYKIGIVTGVRRPEELAYLRTFPSTSLYIRRREETPNMHPVENALYEEDFDATFDNSGPIETLQTTAKRFAERHFSCIL